MTAAPRPSLSNARHNGSWSKLRSAVAEDDINGMASADAFLDDPNPDPTTLSTSPRSTSLRLTTGLASSILSSSPSRSGIPINNTNLSPSRNQSVHRKVSTKSLRPISRTPSLKAAFAQAGTASGTSSLVPSPIISALGDVTPLPSPLMSDDVLSGKKSLMLSSSPPQGTRLINVGEGSVLVTSSGESIDAALRSGSQRRLYAISQESSDSSPPVTQSHGRNRSVSDYAPDPKGLPKRQITVSGTHASRDTPGPLEPNMCRELNYAESRGLIPSVTQPPTPPPSESSRTSDSGARPQSIELFQARGRHDDKKRRWRAVRRLGQGTFSQVMLATSQVSVDNDTAAAQADATTPYSNLDRKTLVAIKVCEHGPAGGACEERVEMSLRRELEIMKSIHHPCLVDLKAWSIETTRSLLVLSYCPGGDLFDVATKYRTALTPPLLRRMFAELIVAVKYLHDRRIVHRDIKLENVLVNLTPAELMQTTDWATYPYSLITLTDLGLSRRVADDEKLETRCGSEDYAAPEVIMGQPYDGRATDGWSLGVLMYALLEARLPFDPHPSITDAHRMRSRTSHRIARVEWSWVDFAGDDGDHDADEAKFREQGLLGAMEVTEALLKRARSRWTLEKVSEHPWVRDAIAVDGGIKFREEEQGEEVV